MKSSLVVIPGRAHLGLEKSSRVDYFTIIDRTPCGNLLRRSVLVLISSSSSSTTTVEPAPPARTTTRPFHHEHERKSLLSITL